jgi:hypothetical protein
MNKLNIVLTLAVTLLLSDRINAQDFVPYSLNSYMVYHYSNGRMTGISYEIYLKKDKGGFGPLIVSATKSGYYNDTVSTGEILKITLEFNTSFLGYHVPYNDFTEIQLDLLSSDRIQNFVYQVYPMPVVNAGSSPYWLKFIFDTCTSITIARGQPTAVEDPARQTLPKSFSLSQNYPNPFNPATTISFSLPSRSLVSLKVFDVLGREVSLLVADELDAGRHTRQWNPQALPSGVYFYRLEAGAFTETKRLLLLR